MRSNPYKQILKMNNSQGKNIYSQKTDTEIIQFPKCGKYPESALVEWIFRQFTLEEIKGFIQHQFNADYFVNQKKFRRFVKLCRLIDSEKLHNENLQKSPPVSDRAPLKYNQPFVAPSFLRRDSQDK